MDEKNRILLEEIRRTSGNTDRLILETEEETLLSDGHDLAFITVRAEDMYGNPVDNARDRVNISVSGGAYLIGTDNGDSTDADGYRLLVIIASDGKPEDALVRVESNSGIKAELRIPVIRADRIPGTSCVQRIPAFPGDCRIPVRKIEIQAEGDRKLTPGNPSCVFVWKELPEGCQGGTVAWQVTNDAGIVTPFAEAVRDGNRVTVTAVGDGNYYLK